MVVKVGGDIPVEQSGLGCGIESHIIEDTSQSPIVLSFQIVAIAVFQHTDGQHILARTNIGCHIVFCRLLSAFVITHLLPVNPYERSTLGLLQTQENLLSLPLGGQSERLSVSSGWIVISRNKRRISLERSRHIAELCIAIAFHLPVAWHSDGAPLAVLEIRLEELLRHFLGSVGKEELPLSIERQMIRGQIVGVSFFLSFLKNSSVLDVIVNVLQILSVHLQRTSSK